MEPEHDPPQPEKVQPEEGVAVSLIVSPESPTPVQASVHDSCPDESATVPFPMNGDTVKA